MNTKLIGTAFIDKVKGLIEDSGVDTLTDILSLSKEAVYRRLRGDVQFSYPEVVIISRKLGISLDELTFGEETRLVFEPLAPQYPTVEKTYRESLKSGIQIFKNIKDAHVYMASSSIPLFFLGEYEHLFRFYYYSLLHNKNSSDVLNEKYGDTDIPQEVIADVKMLLDNFWKMDTTFMLSTGMFDQYFKAIHYFMAVNLISKSEVELIKNDLYKMVEQMEIATACGVNKNGSQLTVYLSDLHIESSWGYIKSEASSVAFARVSLASHVVSHSPHVCKMYSDSMHHLKKYASLISQSGSTQRTEYFRKQRQLIQESIN